MTESESKAAGPQEEQASLPPANFSFLVLSLRTQAELHLGLIHFGEPDEKPASDLGAARHSIDILAMLQEKTRGNLTLEEQRMIDNSLTELRFRYVQAVEEKSGSKQS
jgi:hypothetical protein